MNKYRNEPSAAFRYTFRSKAERNHAFWLESERQAGRIKEWIYEKSYELRVNGKLVGKIYPDFTIINNDESVQIHEVKSPITKTDAWRIRSNLFQALYPDIPYKVIMKFRSWS